MSPMGFWRLSRLGNNRAYGIAPLPEQAEAPDPTHSDKVELTGHRRTREMAHSGNDMSHTENQEDPPAEQKGLLHGPSNVERDTSDKRSREQTRTNAETRSAVPGIRANPGAINRRPAPKQYRMPRPHAATCSALFPYILPQHRHYATKLNPAEARFNGLVTNSVVVPRRT
jgi:hypothetical protein